MAGSRLEKGRPQVTLLSTEAVAKRLGVSRKTVTNWIALGLPAYRIGRLWRIDDDKLDIWLRQQEKDETRGKPG